MDNKQNRHVNRKFLDLQKMSVLFVVKQYNKSHKYDSISYFYDFISSFRILSIKTEQHFSLLDTLY